MTDKLLQGEPLQIEDLDLSNMTVVHYCNNCGVAFATRKYYQDLLITNPHRHNGKYSCEKWKLKFGALP